MKCLKQVSIVNVGNTSKTTKNGKINTSVKLVEKFKDKNNNKKKFLIICSCFVKLA